jgi:hypothetical protein
MYAWFNYIECVLWWCVAAVIAVRVPRRSRVETLAVVLGAVAFVAFGITDYLEAPFSGRIPGWLWGLKIACGAAILASRYTYVGWWKLRWNDRELLFGLAMLIGVGVVLIVQSWLS